MGAATTSVNVDCFDSTYLAKAGQVFLNPSPKYTWEEIVSGADVQSKDGGTRRMSAVGGNTFRGFHRIDRAYPGAKEVFIGYFIERKERLIGELSAVETRDDLNQLSNGIREEIRANLTNCLISQLRSYNKIRKPVDLYVEHLVSMANELGAARAKLVPVLFLPLDSQIFAHQGLCTAAELKLRGLSRASTYSEIVTEGTYAELQDLIAQKAEVVTRRRHQPFHPVYFDLVWNNRQFNWGGNLFETNP